MDKNEILTTYLKCFAFDEIIGATKYCGCGAAAWRDLWGLDLSVPRYLYRWLARVRIVYSPMLHGSLKSKETSS